MKKFTALLLCAVLALSLAVTTQVSASSEESEAAEVMVGTPEEQVDNFARDPYKVALISYEFNNSLCASMKIALEALAPAYNIELTSDAVTDADGVMNAIETYVLQNYDGYIIICQDEFTARLEALVEEYELENKWIACLNPCQPNGYVSHPGVGQSAEKHGKMVVDWVFDHYKDKLGDIDMSKVGHIICSYSKVNDFLIRDEAIYNALDGYGISKDDIFYADTAVGGFSTQTAVDMVSATISAHASDYEYFFVYNTCDDFGLGAGNAVTTMGIEDKTMVACIQADQVIAKWETGDKAGVDGAIYMSNYLYALPVVTGLIALMDGRATWDTLWPGMRAENDTASTYGVSGEYCTFEDFKEVRERINDSVRALGVEIPE